MYVCVCACVSVEILRANKNAGDTLGAPPCPWWEHLTTAPVLHAGLPPGVGFKKKPSWKMPSLSCVSRTPSPPSYLIFYTKFWQHFRQSLLSFLSLSVSLLPHVSDAHLLFFYLFTAHYNIYIYIISSFTYQCPSVVEILQGFQSNVWRPGRREKLSHEKTILLKWWQMCSHVIMYTGIIAPKKNYPSFNQDK